MMADSKTVLRLLKTARGQIDGIIRMVEEDRYCIDISNQLMATESILRKTNREVIHAHMEHCVKQAMETGDSEEKLKEVLALIDKLNR
ncbi:Copper-sensitive operon repressor [uncultured Ruminococcus sp.]|uniref:Copper-sensing transcriptional repressor CsoR n=1 Tax=Massiliimalia timonensis TaxID=1987501 RepID=A0A8J6TXD3_9FIRM|nr:metal-sensing transcriptional repressor [Massiliimalia timonensis]MBC8611005.1 metal-sensing transcriptional repressor [Massiliimalia timonensis]SCH11272.1 Copper-sensitive operon repressor [uncultured Clostridium sp.]SCI49675.1 Copper-sensitive operon repressor [uncultured Ruminococcus sp.]